MAISPVIPVYNRTNLSFERGEGAYLYTPEGERYLDFLSGIAVNSLGHCHPHLVQTLKDQSEKLWHVSNIFSIEPLTRLSKRLVENSFADSVFFCNSGAEAVECGLKAIRKYFDENDKPEKHRVITFDGAFHGRTFGAIAATGTPKVLEGFEPRLPGFDKVAINIEAVKAAITHETAAILIEPVQGEGGIKPIPTEFLQELRKICDEQDLLLFFDEVQCGNGRAAKLFAYQHFDVEPDILATAKGLGGGFPIGACLMKEKVAETLKTGSHGTTFGGNPLATAVGNAVLDILLEEGFMQKVSDIAGNLRDKLESLQNKFPTIVDEVRGLGLLMGIKLRPEFENTKMVEKLRENKLLVNAAGDNVVRIIPPLIIEESHVEEALEIIEKTFGEML
ncbi:MAG: acetylornithine transaminase [Alphaproteobacteria bacterium CG11_big_fil_rev_8_21_14_0_20_44_7]|nr:MAG: acetylornithine transaminase [Alphaproteobacteria bacterium CG11_big_fil_rev_8_21_14_0_20_44_7]